MNKIPEGSQVRWKCHYKKKKKYKTGVLVKIISHYSGYDGPQMAIVNVDGNKVPAKVRYHELRLLKKKSVRTEIVRIYDELIKAGRVKRDGPAYNRRMELGRKRINELAQN